MPGYRVVFPEIARHILATDSAGAARELSHGSHLPDSGLGGVAATRLESYPPRIGITCERTRGKLPNILVRQAPCRVQPSCCNFFRRALMRFGTAEA